MLDWMQSFGEVKRIGIECTGTYSVGSLRYLQQFDIEILEVTAPDKKFSANVVKTTQLMRKIRHMQHFLVYAPSHLKRAMAWSKSLRTMTRMQLIRTLAAWRPDLSGYRDISTAYKIALKSLARRYLKLHDEIADFDVMIAVIVDELAPELITGKAIGYESAAQLLITIGNNPECLKSEASFAALCGVNPSRLIRQGQ